MKFFLLLCGFIGVGTVIGLTVPAWNNGSAIQASAAEPEGELLGSASQVVPGQRDVIHAGVLAGAKASLRAARDKRQPGADWITITADPPQSMRMTVALPEGGQLNFLMSFEEQGASTLMTQKVTLSGNVGPDMRSTLENMRSTGAFNMVAAGSVPTIG